MERLTFAIGGSRVEGKTLSGIVHVYGSVTVDGRKHSFAPGAFAKSIARSSTVADSSPARQSLCCDTSLLRGPCARVRSAYPTVS